MRHRRAIRTKAIAVALQRTDGSQRLTVLNVQPGTDQSIRTVGEKARSGVEANQSFQLERAKQCLNRNISTGHMALKEVGERQKLQHRGWKAE